MGFSQKKILSVGLDRYLDMVGKSLGEYGVEGIHDYREIIITGRINRKGESEVSPIEGFAKKVPVEAEVVVSYRMRAEAAGDGGQYFVWQNGIALIPKER